MEGKSIHCIIHSKEILKKHEEINKKKKRQEKEKIFHMENSREAYKQSYKA